MDSPPLVCSPDADRVSYLVASVALLKMRPDTIIIYHGVDSFKGPGQCGSPIAERPQNGMYRFAPWEKSRTAKRWQVRNTQYSSTFSNSRATQDSNPPAQTPGKTLNSPEGSALIAAFSIALALVIDRWPTLPEDVRQAILTTLKGATRTCHPG